MATKKIFLYATHEKVYPQDQSNFIAGYDSLSKNHGLDVVDNQVYQSEMPNNTTGKLTFTDFANVVSRHKDIYIGTETHMERKIIKAKPSRIYTSVTSAKFPAVAGDAFLLFSSVNMFTANSPLPNLIRMSSNNATAGAATLKLIAFPKMSGRLDQDATSFAYNVDVNNKLVSLTYDTTDVNIKTLAAPAFVANQEVIWNVEDFFSNYAQNGDSYLRNTLGNYMLVAEYAAPAAPIANEYISAEINFFSQLPVNQSALAY